MLQEMYGKVKCKHVQHDLHQPYTFCLKLTLNTIYLGIYLAITHYLQYASIS